MVIARKLKPGIMMKPINKDLCVVNFRLLNVPMVTILGFELYIYNPGGLKIDILTGS